MDVGMSGEVTVIEVINGTHLQSKECEYSSKPSSSDMLKLNEMVIRSDYDDYSNSHGFFADTLDADNLDRIGASEHACVSPHCMDDAGVMVEELTLRNYSIENLTVGGTSSSRDKMQTRQNKWQKLYPIAGGSRTRISYGDAAYSLNSEKMTNFWEDAGYTVNPGFLDQKPLNNCNDVAVLSNIKNPVSSNALLAASVMRTKVLSQSGFSDYFVKNMLEGKGIICRGPAREGLVVEFKGQTYPKAAGVTKVDPGALLISNRETFGPPSRGTSKPFSGLFPDVSHDGISLREWLKSGQNKVNKVKSLFIFRKIVDMVNNSHLRPSYFKLMLSNEVMYLGSSVQREFIEKLRDKDVFHLENGRN